MTFLNVLEHHIDPNSALSEAYRILRPGGIVLIRLPNAVLHITSRRLFSNLYKLWNRFRKFDHSVIPRNSFKRVNINMYLTKNGFIIPVFHNSCVSWGNVAPNSGGFKKAIININKGLTELLRVISGGSYLVASSLSITATKPIV